MHPNTSECPKSNGLGLRMRLSFAAWNFGRKRQKRKGRAAYRSGPAWFGVNESYELRLARARRARGSKWSTGPFRPCGSPLSVRKGARIRQAIGVIDFAAIGGGEVGLFVGGIMG